jgi:CHAD domain-containing protein
MVRVTPAAPLWIASRALLAERGDELFRCWNRVKLSFAEDDIHDLRVASRRLREGLALFAPCFPRKDLARVATRVKRLTGLLGTMRNTDEAIRFFEALGEALPAGETAPLEPLLADLRRERRKERDRLQEGLRALNPRALRIHFFEACNAPLVFAARQPDPFTPITEFGRVQLTERLTPALELVPEASREEEVAAQHRLRIAVKRLRYRFEILEPLVHGPYRELHQQIKEYQEQLGTLHDLDVFSALVAARLPGAVGAHLLVALADRRRTSYATFCRLQASCPLPELGDRLEAAL